MTGLRTLLAALIAVLCGSGTAQACEPLPPQPFWTDKKIKVGSDCAFTRAEQNFDRDLRGAKAINIGGGKVGQKISASAVCATHESLLVVDCNAGTGVMINGAPEDDADFGTGPARKIAMIQPPHGPIALTASVTIPALAARAKRAGLKHTTRLSDIANGMKKRNRYNPFCGCTLFYPGSTGALK